MLNTILGLKGKMTQSLVTGARLPVTKIMAGPCVVTQIKKEDKDGYLAIQVGFSERKLKNTSKQLQGHFKTILQKDSAVSPRFLREIRLSEETDKKVGDMINVSEVLQEGDIITVTSVSKGKGFAGVVKRHKFAGGPKTHGQSDRLRAPGSIGQGTTPGRVYKGKKMAGKMGNDTVSIKNLKVLTINQETNEIEVSGPVPGTVGSLIIIKKQ